MHSLNYQWAMRSHYWADLDWIWTDGFTGCVHIRLVSLWTLGKMRCERSAFWTKHHKTSSEQLFHHSNKPISSPNSVWLRSTFDRIESESFLNPPRLGGFECSPYPIRLRSHWWTRCPNPVKNQSAYVHTGGLAIQIQSKPSRSPLVWTHLGWQNKNYAN